MGLTLREFEQEKRDSQFLIEKIKKKYPKNGLHIAWFVQNGLFGKIVGNIIETGATKEEIIQIMNDLLHSIDNYVAFISYEDKPKIKSSEIITKIHAFSPKIFIISSMEATKKVCDRVIITIKAGISNYICEEYSGYRN